MERFFLRGGNYNNTSNAGPKNCNANNRRSNTYAFGLCFVESQFPAAQGRQVSAIEEKSPFPSSIFSIEENKNWCLRPVGFIRPPYGISFVMKTYNNIWDSVVSFENMLCAYRKAAKCKRYHSEVLAFSENLEENIIQLQNELIWHQYRPLPPRQFVIYEPKKRTIFAPVFRDRVVHHAISNEIEPLIDRRFIYDTYACRLEKGPQRAIMRLQHHAQMALREWDCYWAFKGDIKSFFPSINHIILKQLLQRIITDKNVLGLLFQIIDSYGDIGLPIGALLSQLFANLMLDPLDHLIKEQLRCRYYVRYMDDFIVLAKSKDDARSIGREITYFIEDTLLLAINPKSSIIKGTTGVGFCGCRVWPSHIVPVRGSFRRSVRHIRKMAKLYNNGTISLDRFKASLMSFLGHYKHMNAQHSIQSVLDKMVLKGGPHE